MDLSAPDLRNAQMIMLMIMRKIHAVCEKHHIKYWLDYGSLIGAVRHGGFIPWDDDFDICMMREDYERFNKIAQEELGDEYFWQTWDTDPGFIFSFGKVRLKNTIWKEKITGKIILKEQGVFVDIFPVDHVPDNKAIRNLLFFIYNYIDYVFRVRNFIFKETFFKRIIASMLRIVTTNSFFKKQLMSIIYWCSKSEKSRYVSMLSLGTAKRNLIEKKFFSEVVLHKFENTELYIPKCFHDRLQKCYGDYMTMPSENQRIGGHAIDMFDFGPYSQIGQAVSDTEDLAGTSKVVE